MTDQRIQRAIAQLRAHKSFCLVAALATGLLGHPEAIRAQNQLSFAFVVTDPWGELDRHIDTFNGPYVTYLRDVGSSERLALGATGMGGTYGEGDRPVPIPGYHATTHNSMGFVMGVFQFKARTGVVQPYFQGTGGLGWIETTTTVGCEDCPYGVGQETAHRDLTFVWGGSSGVLVRIYERNRAPKGDSEIPGPTSDRKPIRVYLDIATRYLRGGRAEYLPGDPVIMDDGRIEMDELVESNFEAFQYQVGASVRF